MLGLNMKRGKTLLLNVEGVHVIRIKFDRMSGSYCHIAIEAPQEVRISRDEDTMPDQTGKARVE